MMIHRGVSGGGGRNWGGKVPRIGG
jgi:hypothetical protein